MVLAAAACGGRGSNTPGTPNPERQSEAEYDLARHHFERGEPKVALEHAKRAVALNDENSKALYYASYVHLFFCSGVEGLGGADCQLGEAEKLARAAIKAEDSFRDARNLLGNILILEGKVDEAIQLLEPLVKDVAYVASHLAWGNLGWAQTLKGAPDQAITSLRNAIAIQPRFCVGHYRLGIAYEKKGDLKQSEESLSRAVTGAECQDLQDAWEARARVRAKLGKLDESRSDYEKCRAISAESQTGKVCSRMLGGTAPGLQSAHP